MNRPPFTRALSRRCVSRSTSSPRSVCWRPAFPQANSLLSPRPGVTDDLGMETYKEARTMNTPVFSVTLDVVYFGRDSHGTITEVVEAANVTDAERKVISDARDILPSNVSLRPLVTVQLKRDRDHRFAEGDLIAHVDSPHTALVVGQQTWKESNGVAYPTYILTERHGPDEVEDVLDTDDLVSYESL